jgi:hypothetical protein
VHHGVHVCGGSVRQVFRLTKIHKLTILSSTCSGSSERGATKSGI